MRIKTIKISGFKPIPFSANYTPPISSSGPAKIIWETSAFQFPLATENPMMNAIIGPNSSGKSSILHALDIFFSSKTKLPQELYNNKAIDRPVIVELTFVGKIKDTTNPTWFDDQIEELTIAQVWKWESSRVIYIKQSTGMYNKAGTNDKNQLDELLPKYRLLAADSKLADGANPEKNDLISDLIQAILEGQGANNKYSIIYKLQRAVREMQNLVDRENAPNRSAWREIEELEQALSVGLGPITPGNPSIRLQMEATIPDLSQVFMKGKIQIEDGVELNFSQHGLGLQRSFVASALHAWCEIIGRQEDGQDYLFAIEEPELYLHPHAARVFIKTFEEIAQQDQIIFTTHSSEFVNQVPLDNVISIRRQRNHRHIVQPNLDSLLPKEKTKVQRYLREHRSDMLFARSVLLVEGASEQFAIPAFAQKLGSDLDKVGVSIVFVNGKNNFQTYNQILSAFGIQHVILADGDGNAASTKTEYEAWGVDGIFVLDEDFEYAVVAAIGDKNRFLEIYNECRNHQGKAPQTLDDLHIDVTAASLKGSWWRALKDKMYADIFTTYRSEYDSEKKDIQDLLKQIADSVIKHDHLLPSAVKKRWATLLKKEGKPLAGRVLGEMLTKEEIEGMSTIVDAIDKAVDLAS